MESSIAPALSAVLRIASRIICLIVVASFVVFVVHQTQGASTHQQEVLSEKVPAPGEGEPSPTSAHTPSAESVMTKEREHEHGVRQAIDEASATLTSPFSGITSSSSSQWLVSVVNLLLALVVYGFGLGYLARVLRVR